jgi:hypothetical protein
MRFLWFASVCWLLVACGETHEQTKPSYGPDEFKGFGPLRGPPKEKSAAADAPAKGKAAEGEGGDTPAPEGSSGKGPSKQEVLAVLSAGEKRLQVCLDHHGEAGVYQVQLTLGPDGKVHESKPVATPTRKQEPDAYADIPAEVDGGKSLTSVTSKCVARILGDLKFPTFEGQAVTFTYPVILKK